MCLSLLRGYLWRFCSLSLTYQPRLEAGPSQYNIKKNRKYRVTELGLENGFRDDSHSTQISNL